MSRTQCLHYLATWKKEIQPTFFPTPSTRELAATTTPDVLLYNKAWTQWIQEDPDVIYFGEIIKPKKIKEDPDMPPPKRVRYPEPSDENLTITHTTDGYPSISKEEILRRVFKPVTQNDPLEAEINQSPMPAPAPLPDPAPHFQLAPTSFLEEIKTEPTPAPPPLPDPAPHFSLAPTSFLEEIKIEPINQPQPQARPNFELPLRFYRPVAIIQPQP